MLDSSRPEIPYSKGLELTIHPHNPPLPIAEDSGLFRDESLRPECTDAKKMSDFSQSQWCLDHPPIETPQHQSHHLTRKLRVIEELAIRDQHGAQVVRCCLDGDETRQYAAKIYDSFYYTYQQNYWKYSVIDCAWKADDDYSREALAYQKLVEFGIDGKFTPKFHGSWTFDIAFTKTDGKVVNRPVRLILMEYLSGTSLYWILNKGDINEITPHNRLNIYAKVLEADTTLDFYGVLHNDISPRNVLLIGPYKNNNLPRVYLIDFNLARIEWPLNSENLDPEDRSTKPVSPRYHHWGHLNSEFFNWIPNPLTETIHYKGWLKKVWGDENERFGGPSRFVKRDYNDEAEYIEPSE